MTFGSSLGVTSADQLANAEAIVGGSDFRSVESNVLGELNAGTSDTYELMLEQGIAYKFVAVCDSDCLDVDLWIADPSGQEVAVDELDDAIPIVDLVPESNGVFTIGVEMIECVSEPCFYGLSILVQAQ